MSSSIRLGKVTGYQGRGNDVIYMQPKVLPSSSVVIFFPGDVQDYPEIMEAHRDNKTYIRWNLENMAVILQSHFENNHIVIIRPSSFLKLKDSPLLSLLRPLHWFSCLPNRLASHKLATFMEFLSTDQEHRRMEFRMFSCYDNFVPCNNSGVPDHTPMHFALHHLERLLQNTSMKLKEHDGVDKTDIRLDKCDVVLIGFSKGCVVLNQFLYEFHYLKTLTPDDETMSDLVNRIHDMYWLDGGHPGVKNTWITSRSLLETLVRLGINIHIHVTPYQINDDRRPWIRKEEKAFSECLKKLGAPVERVVHFESQIPNLKTHLEILNSFKQDIT